MTNRPHEETINLVVIPLEGISDPTAPTAAEINAGVTVITDMTADGWAPNWTNNTVATDMMRGFIVQSVGTRGVQATLQFARQDDSTTTRSVLARRNQFWAALVPFAGVDENGDPNEVEAGDVIDLYHFESHGISDVASGANTDQQYQVMLAGKREPLQDVEVVGGS